MLKMTGVKSEQMSEIGKYLCIEKGWRGGVSYIAKQYAKGNSKQYRKNHDPKKPSKFITCLTVEGGGGVAGVGG